MTAANHAVTGALIAVIVDKPVLALPIAFLSHFVQDAIPHYGFPGHGGFGRALKHRLFRIMFYTDPILLAIVLGILIHYSADAWVYLAALLAIGPDFEWLFAYFGFERRNKVPPRTPFAKIHAQVQWAERPWGAIVELAWFILGTALLITLLQ
jgi:hypothetical protein